jgi:integrase
VPECEALLQEAAANRPEAMNMLGFVALALFGGIRPLELRKMEWPMVDLDAGTAIVFGKHAKTRTRRVVDLSENAVAWLRLAWRLREEFPERNVRQGPICDARRLAYADKICPPSFALRWIELREKCGWTPRGGDGAKPWPHDAMRHTYASMHYAMHQNEPLLKAQMGTGKDMLHQHYRALKTREEAERFWALAPKGRGDGR